MSSFYSLHFSTRGGWVVKKLKIFVYVVIECPLNVFKYEDIYNENYESFKKFDYQSFETDISLSKCMKNVRFFELYIFQIFGDQAFKL